jgi:hypothetical protein
MTVLLINILGWTGVALLLLAYALVSTRRVEGDSFTYQVLNIVGALLLIANSFYFGSYPSVGVNIAWIGIALYTLIKISRKQKMPTQI